MENKNKFKKLLHLIFSPAKTLGSLFMAVLSSLILLSAMAGVIYISNGKSFKNPIFSSISCSLLTIPLTLIWAPKLRELIRQTDDKNQIQIENQKTEIAELKRQVQSEKLTTENLQSKITMLENLVFNSKSSVDILKVGYKEYTKTSTIRIKEKINESSGKLFSSASYDEALLILDCKTTYQRGIDFKNLKLNYLGQNKNAVVVTNLKPEYTSSPSFEYSVFLSELRHVETDKKGNIKKIHYEKDADNQLKEIENRCKENFESTFQCDENTESLEETNEILKIAKDCIRLLLSPYFNRIEFDTTCEIRDAKPWTSFLQQQVEIYKGISKNLEVK